MQKHLLSNQKQKTGLLYDREDQLSLAVQFRVLLFCSNEGYNQGNNFFVLIPCLKKKVIFFISNTHRIVNGVHFFYRSFCKTLEAKGRTHAPQKIQNHEIQSDCLETWYVWSLEHYQRKFCLFSEIPPRPTAGMLSTRVPSQSMRVNRRSTFAMLIS